MDQVMKVFEMPVVQAALLLVLAFVAAAIARSLIDRLIGATKIKDLLAKADDAAEDGEGSARGYVGQLVYLVTFLLFVPGIFATLGIDAASAPILEMLNKLWGFVPNILGATVIVAVGLIVAKLVRELLVPVFQRLHVDDLQERAGIEAGEGGKLSTTLAYVVYVLIVIPVVVMALQTLGISAISDPAVNMLDTVFAFIPNIVVAIIIVTVGELVARLASQVTERLLATSGIDAKAAEATDGRLEGFVVSKVVATVVRVVIDILFVVEATNVVNLDVLTGIGSSVIGYLPSVLAAVVIAILAIFAADAAAKALRGNGLGGYALVVRAAILAVATFMVLSQLGVAPSVVNTAFTALVAAVAVACAVAFGVGGKDAAAKALERWTADANKLEAKVAAAGDAKADKDATKAV